MKCATRSIRVSVVGLLAVSLAAVMLCAQSPVAVARLVARPNHRCCCGTCDGKCCGMACCKPSQSSPAVPPARTLGNFKSLVLVSWHAPATSAPAGIEQDIQRASASAHALWLPTLQSEHVRIQT
jgi:hypothetical protein